MADIIIIGGGASGMAAAIAASRSPENRITLLERQSRVGRKLLSTGNGRCNLTNLGGLEGHYHGADEGFSRFALERFDALETLEFFSRLGLRTVTEPGGRVYPLSDHAGSVLDILRFALERENITLCTGVAAQEIQRRSSGFAVVTDGGEYLCDRVIVACGGAAGAKVGGVMDGYRLLRALGHRRTGLYPALTQLKTPAEYPRALKGVKADAQVRVLAGRRCLAQSRGELLFTETGVSGPVVFEVSRAASVNGEGLCLSLDFMCDYRREELLDWLFDARSRLGGSTADCLFTGSVHNRLGKMLCKYASIAANRAVPSLTDAELERAADAAKDFRLDITGAAGFDSAQVTAGGISTEEFNPETMESRLVPGLYACGEVLDVDGDCGGFNLQWAWSSGRLAGGSAGC